MDEQEPANATADALRNELVAICTHYAAERTGPWPGHPVKGYAEFLARMEGDIVQAATALALEASGVGEIVRALDTLGEAMGKARQTLDRKLGGSGA